MSDNKPNPQSLFNNIPKDSMPPVHLWDPPFCGDIDICIHADGRWSYLNSPFTRMPLVKLFSKVLKKEQDKYFLVTPVEKVGIKVEAEPFVIIDYEYDHQQKQLALKTNCDEIIIVGADHPLEVTTDNQDTPYPKVLVRNNLWALLKRNVFYDLVELAEQRADGDKTECVILSSGKYFSLGRF